MTRQFIDASESPVVLSRRHGSLCVEVKEVRQIVPADELEAVILSHPQSVITSSALSLIADAGVPLVACDQRRLPVSVMMPIAGHTTQTERFRFQADASLPIRKRAWQAVVKAKVTAQALIAEEVTGDGHKLFEMVDSVRSGDSTNVESHAARVYWGVILAPSGFRREPGGEWPNPLFDYGYAIIRAIVARAVCAHGLHPSLGINHHNRYDPLCLVHDLMEPLRPLVDRKVISVLSDGGRASDFSPQELTSESKKELIEAVSKKYAVDGSLRSLSWVARSMCASLARVFSGEDRNFRVPRVVPGDRV